MLFNSVCKQKNLINLTKTSPLSEFTKVFLFENPTKKHLIFKALVILRHNVKYRNLMITQKPLLW